MYKRDFREIIGTLKVRKELTNADIAKRLGVSSSMFQNYIADEGCNISINKLIILNEAYGITAILRGGKITFGIE